MKTIYTLATVALLAATASAAADYATPNAAQISKMARAQWVGKELSRVATHSKTHIGQSKSTLKSAANQSGKIKSSFTDKKAAVRATQNIIRGESKQIAQWLRSSKGKPGSRLTLGTQGSRPLQGINAGGGRIGTAAVPGGRPIPSYGARVVLQRDPKSKLGFRIHNAYPVVARSTAKQLKTFRGTPAGRIGGEFRRVMPPPRGRR
ncbi:RNase A-like domain-containing protein [Tropicimonas sp. S265A]|uniref:RNase A-like domain-containing protein n=1 Tax=Tropicimonas sp. S265A TaxID=3415134 RepID=UPI003C7A347D